MLNKKSIEAIAKTLKLDVATFEAAIKATDEQELSIPEVSVFTTEELTTRDQNQKRTGYNEGKDAGIEIFVKEQKTKLGVEFDGKDPEKLIEAFKTKVLNEAKIEPNTKVEELNKTVKQLQDNVIKLQGDLSEKDNLINSVKLDNQLQSLLPENITKLLTKDEILNNVKSKYEFVNEEGKLVAKLNGEVVKHQTTQSPIEVKDVINSYLTERNWIETSDPGRQGRGGSGDSGRKPVYQKLSELVNEFQQNGKSVNGEEFQAAVEAAQKDNPNFELKS